MVRVVGIEPTLLSEPDFESGASTSSTTPAHSPPILAGAHGPILHVELGQYMQRTAPVNTRPFCTSPRPFCTNARPSAPTPHHRHVGLTLHALLLRANALKGSRASHSGACHDADTTNQPYPDGQRSHPDAWHGRHGRHGARLSASRRIHSLQAMP